MKKLIALLLAMIMVLSMAACNNTNVNPTEDNNKQTEPDPTVEYGRITPRFFMVSTSS